MSTSRSLLVFGGTGRCGLGVLQRGVDLGFQVTAFVRNPASARSKLGPELCGKLSIVEGDILKAEQVDQAVNNGDDSSDLAIISCIASYNSPHNQMSTLTQNIMDAAAKKERPKRLRYIVFGVFGVREDLCWWSSFLFGLVSIFSPWKFDPAIKDHMQQLKLLSASPLNYTVFQTPSMVEKPFGTKYVGGSPEECPRASIFQMVGYLDAADLRLKRLDDEDLKILQIHCI